MSGRKKIEIKKIDGVNKRRVTFSGRRGGLFKKAHELSVMCDAEVGVIVFSDTNCLYEFSSSSMRGIIDRYNRDTESSTSQMQMQMQDEMRQEHEAIQELLRNQVTNLKTENERLMGNNLGGLSVQQLKQLEQQLNDGLISIKQKKDAMLFEEMERSNCKERELGYENDALRGQVEQLKRFIPSISDAHSKHEPASQLDTACYYECGNTPPETALQLRLTCGDHSRQNGASPRIRHDSSSFGNDKI